MRIDVLTLFPEMFEGPLSESILKQAREKGLIDVRLTNIRDYARDKHRTADDYQYGGGSGMVMKPEPIIGAIRSVLDGDAFDADRVDDAPGGTVVVLLSARGRLFDQQLARELSEYSRLVLICGRYKGIDERVSALATHEISVGDYVLTGGELPAAIIVDVVARLIPGVLGAMESAETDSHFDGMLGPPVYTRPEVYEGDAVPEVLLSGNHERIRIWRRTEALRATRLRRPELLGKTELSDEDRKILELIEEELGQENS
ncbi:tRNA (guanosine(37)-N1)-methyltransferase TrmD [bacterium]|nr:tRNA (guanosine(37)-N1)-methyltransferase TrmD [bacterium]